MAPAEQSKAFKTCPDYLGKTFKYTATIAPSDPEDPIIIIERSTIFGGSVPLITAAGIAVVAFILGAVIAMKWMRSRPGTQA